MGPGRLDTLVSRCQTQSSQKEPNRSKIYGREFGSGGEYFFT